MISQETKDAIEKEARECALYGFPSSQSTHFDRRVHSYITGATNYAEKLEEAEKGLKEINTHLGIQPSDGWALSVNQIQYFKEIIESKDCELAQLRKDYEFLEEDNRDMEGRLRVYPPSEAEKEAAEWHRKYLELTQLKEIAETMAKALEAQPNMYDSAIFAKRVALTGYAEWCKQNLK